MSKQKQKNTWKDHLKQIAEVTVTKKLARICKRAASEDKLIIHNVSYNNVSHVNTTLLHCVTNYTRKNQIITHVLKDKTVVNYWAESLEPL